MSRRFQLGLARHRHPHPFRVLRFLRALRAMPFSSFPTGAKQSSEEFPVPPSVQIADSESTGLCHSATFELPYVVPGLQPPS
jgi:hypothetical protein